MGESMVESTDRMPVNTDDAEALRVALLDRLGNTTTEGAERDAIFAESVPLRERYLADLPDLGRMHQWMNMLKAKCAAHWQAINALYTKRTSKYKAPHVRKGKEGEARMLNGEHDKMCRIITELQMKYSFLQRLHNDKWVHLRDDGPELKERTLTQKRLVSLLNSYRLTVGWTSPTAGPFWDMVSEWRLELTTGRKSLLLD